MTSDNRERSPTRSRTPKPLRDRDTKLDGPLTPRTPNRLPTPMSAPSEIYDPNDYWDGLADVKSCNWIYKMDELVQNTPSRNSSTQIRHISLTEEIEKRAKGIMYMFGCCQTLRLSRSVAMTAAYYFHRFYMRKDLTSHHYFEIAAASLFIAGKAEECRRRLADVVKVCARIALRGKINEVIDENSKIYWKWKDLLTHLEEVMLETLCFEVTEENAYKFCLKALKLDEEPSKQNTEWCAKSRGIYMASTQFFEITYRLPLILLYRTNEVSAVGLIVGCSKENIVMPENFFESELHTTVEQAWKCYEDLVKLGKELSHSDPNIQVLPHVPKFQLEDFTRIANVKK